jgi:hypothetical protein
MRLSEQNIGFSGRSPGEALYLPVVRGDGRGGSDGAFERFVSSI